jgi:hypothetical protein
MGCTATEQHSHGWRRRWRHSYPLGAQIDVQLAVQVAAKKLAGFARATKVVPLASCENEEQGPSSVFRKRK